VVPAISTTWARNNYRSGIDTLAFFCAIPIVVWIIQEAEIPWSLAGHVFYLIAAWYLCGLLGAPTFLLRPEQVMTILPENTAISLGTTILICMTLGCGFMFLSRRVALQGK
jgi:hypothetical protein